MLLGRGFTLVELMVTLAVAIILTMIAVPAVQGLLERQRLSAAVEAVQAQFVFAKSEAAKRSQAIAVRVAAGPPWAVGVGDNVTCNAAACTLTYRQADGAAVTRVHAITGADYAGAVVATSVAGGGFNFEPVRGTVNPGTLTLTSPASNLAVDIRIDATGRMVICSPNFGRYPACS